MSAVFLTVEEVLELHAFQVEQFGGDPGLRDMGLLESAIAQASQQFGGQFLHEGLAAMASAYLFHIVQNHPFADGNKRTGLHAALTFLAMNDIDLDIPADQGEALVIGVATGQIGKSEVAERFRTWGCI